MELNTIGLARSQIILSCLITNKKGIVLVIGHFCFSDRTGVQSLDLANISLLYLNNYFMSVKYVI